MPRITIRPSLRFIILQRDDFTCRYCGRKSPNVILEIDHANPVANNGDNNINNLITSCRECNSGKSDSIIDNIPEYVPNISIYRMNQSKKMIHNRIEKENIIKILESIVYHKFLIKKNDSVSYYIRCAYMYYVVLEIPLFAIKTSLQEIINNTYKSEDVFDNLDRWCKSLENKINKKQELI